MQASQPTIGEVIKQARLRKKLSADEVAELCNVSRSLIYTWESSDFILPKNFAVLRKALGLTLRELRAANRGRFLIAA